MWSKMGTTESRSDGGPGDGQERRGERPGSHPAAVSSRSEEEGANYDQSRPGQDRVVAGQSDGSPVDAERPTWFEGQIPDAAGPIAGGHKGEQVMAEMKSVGTQTYEDDKTLALADLPEQSATGTTGAPRGQPDVSLSRPCPPMSRCNTPAQCTQPHSLPRGIDTTGQAGAGFVADQSPVPPAQAAVRELQQTQRKESHAAAGAIGGNDWPGITGEDGQASTVGNTEGFRTETEMEPKDQADDTQIGLVIPEVGQMRLSGGHDTFEADDVQRQVPVGRHGSEQGADRRQEHILVERPGSEQGADRRQEHVPVGRHGSEQGADRRHEHVPVQRQGSKQGTDRRQEHVPVERQGSEQGAERRQEEVSVEIHGREQGAVRRQEEVPVERHGREQGRRQVPVERHGSEQGANRRQEQVPAETSRDANDETRPPERGEGGRTSVETQTEISAERCRTSVNLLLEDDGDDAKTVSLKEHIIHEMSQGSRQLFQCKTAYGLALHVLEHETWKADKIWSSHTADSNMSEAGVHNVLKELHQHNKKIGHIVEYFSQERSKRLDVIQLIQKIHEKCDFCETIYNSIT